MVGPTELESVTSCVSSRRSNQLSYGPVRKQETYYENDPNDHIDQQGFHQYKPFEPLLIIKMERFMILPPPEAFAGKLSTTDSRTERACRRPKIIASHCKNDGNLHELVLGRITYRKIGKILKPLAIHLIPI